MASASTPLFRKFELQALETYRADYEAKAWLWEDVSTQQLLLSGYIESVEDVRRRRLADGSYQDFGLDGLGERPDNGFDGIQAKRWTRGTLDSRELGSYMAATFAMRNSSSLNGGVLYHATGSKVSKNVQLTINQPKYNMHVHQIEPVDKGGVKKEVTWDAEMTYTPTESQAHALSHLEAAIGSTTIFAAPCGTGKTTVLGWHIAKAAFRTIVVAAPLIASAQQNLERLKKFVPIHKPIAFWSGSTNPDLLKKKLAAGHAIVSTTFESANVVAKCLAEVNRAPSDTCVIIDEAHNLSPKADSDCRLLAFGGEPCRTTILATATPVKCLRNELGDALGEATEFRYTMREAIERKEICDYTVTIPLISDIKFRPVEMKELDAGENTWDAMGRAIFHAGTMLHDGSRRHIVYLRSLAECEAYEATFEVVCKNYLGVVPWVRRITSDTTSARRTAILKKFQEAGMELRIVTSIRILDEAIDIPKCSGIFLADVSSSRANERSTVRAVQRLSRATRLDRSNPLKVASICLWTGADNEELPNLLSQLRENDPKFSSRVRVVSSNFDKAVGNAEVQKISHLALEEWKGKYIVTRMSPQDLVEVKVNALCGFRESRPRKGESIRTVLPDGTAVSVDYGSFLGCIRLNWVPNTVPATSLTVNQKSRLEASCIWLPKVILVWQRLAEVDSYKPSFADKFAAFTVHCAIEKPKQHHVLKVTTESGDSFTFDGGRFLTSIYLSWVPNAKPKCVLTLDQKKQLELVCPWLQAAILSWQKKATNKTYQPTVDERLWALAKYCAKERPIFTDAIEVKFPPGHTCRFRSGIFLTTIRNNWLPNKSAIIPLTAVQRLRLEEACSWLNAAIESWRLQEENRPSYIPSVEDKVFALIERCASNRPKVGKILTVTNTYGKEFSFDAGAFLSCLRGNWEDKKKPQTSLLPEQMTRLLKACGWLEAVIEKWKEQSYKPSVQDRILAIAMLCKVERPGRSALLVKTDGQQQFTFDAGAFVDSIKLNWVIAAKPTTTVTETQKQLLETSCEWFAEAKRKWQAK